MTAEEYLLDNIDEIFGWDTSQFGEVEKHFKIFTKMKCEELLKIVAEKAKIYDSKYDGYHVCEDSILNAVDLNEFIK